ncbi:MAG: hypothetical protein ACRD96_28910, partial [Bryobacteraceae bacterium]
SRALTLSNLTRVQFNLTPANILTASLLYNYIDADRTGLSFLEPVETTVNRRQNLYFTSIRDQWFFGRGTGCTSTSGRRASKYPARSPAAAPGFTTASTLSMTSTRSTACLAARIAAGH